MRRNIFLFAVPMIALSACVTAPPRPAEFGVARAKIDAAEAAFARSDPHASLYLDLAVQQMGHARAAFSDNDVVTARSWAKRAAADADLARSLALTEKARILAEQGWDEVERLKDQQSRPLSPSSRSLPSSR